MKKLSALALASLAIVPAASAGVWSVVGVEWYTPTSTGTTTAGTTIGFVANDLEYSLKATANAPFYDALGMHPRQTLTPVVSGVYRYVLDWAPSYAGESEPTGAVATIQIKGAANLNSYAVVTVPNKSASGYAHLYDPNYLGLVSGSLAEGQGAWQTDPRAHGNNGSQTVPGAIGSKGVTNDGNLHFACVFTIGASCTLDATSTATLLYGGEAFGQASVDVKARLRLTHVDGVRVQPDL